MMANFDIENNSNSSVVGVSGEVDLAVAGKFQAAIAEAAGGGGRVVIDLSACEFIDSTAIAVMVRAHRELAAADRGLVVCSAHRQVRRVLEVTGLTANGLVVDDLEQALS